LATLDLLCFHVNFRIDVFSYEKWHWNFIKIAWNLQITFSNKKPFSQY
jgi:hypothetical protein